MSQQNIKPNASGLLKEWDYFGAGTPWQAISKATIAPNAPSTDSYIYTIEMGNSEDLELETIENVEQVTDIKIQIYGQCDGIEPTDLEIELRLPARVITFTTVTLPGIHAWLTSEKNSLDITKNELDNAIIRLTSGDYGGNIGYVYAIYAEITYTEPEPAPSGDGPLSKRTKTMSGYNYFIRNYILRKNKSLTPYKLPDGTLFE